MSDERKEDRLPLAHRLLKRVTPWLRAAHEVLAAIDHAREGAGFSRLLAAAAGTGTILSILMPEQAAYDQLRARGYKPVRTTLGAFLCRCLSRSELPRSSEPADDRVRIVTWDAPEDPGAIAAIYSDDEFEDGPFVLDGNERPLADAIDSIAWRDHTDLMVSCVLTRERVVGRQSDYDLELVPLAAPGAYIGEPGLEWFVERLKRHASETRSMLLTGPTGVGKSTLGRLIAANVQGGRLLKVSSNALKLCSVTDVLDLVRFLSPSVLLLDDLTQLEGAHDHYGGSPDKQMLELLESVHGRARLVIATLMTEDHRYRTAVAAADDATDGESYYSGMRPGRIDEVVRVKRPSPRVREQILLHYLGGEAALRPLGLTPAVFAELVEKTDTLTGAYLREIAHRLKIHGTKTWRSEVASVKAAAPRSVPLGRHHRRYRRRASRRKPKAELPGIAIVDTATPLHDGSSLPGVPGKDVASHLTAYGDDGQDPPGEDL